MFLLSWCLSSELFVRLLILELLNTITVGTCSVLGSKLFADPLILDLLVICWDPSEALLTNYLEDKKKVMIKSNGAKMLH